jgi:uncharacterized protein (DUF885 family)
LDASVDASLDASLDARLETLVRQRFDALMTRFPVYASYLGLHEHDGSVADGSRDAMEQDIVDGRRFLAQLESLDPARLSADGRTERELAIFATRRQIFDDDVHRVWERRVSGTDDLGDGIFLLLARQSRPLEERLAGIASRLEAAPQLLAEHRTRLGDRPMRLWNELELEAVGSMPTLFTEVVAAARTGLERPDSLVARLEKAAGAAESALEEYSTWLREQLARADDEFALGADRYDQLIELRAFDGLDADDILQVGLDQLDRYHAARREVATEIDPAATEEDVLDRIKSDHPGDFEGALEAYRRAMAEARQFMIDRDIVSDPAGASLSIIPTPEYLRNVIPFAAYFAPARFERGSGGIYIVTPSVDGAGGGRPMREHNYASIYNTSIHEAYPGHHLQLTAAHAHPSLARVLVDAPEFVEGWAMYCEQMMREEGFDTSPEHRLMMYTDSIWRACRIILDVRLHRGQIGVDEATDFLIEHTGFERPNARAEVHRFTYTPTYQLSYLLGKVLLLRLRDDERARLGSDFSLRGFHDAMLRQGGLPISFQRRLLAETAAGAETATAQAETATA